MLDLRLYRAAFVPVLLAVIVVAFSLHGRPAPLDTTLSADAFDAAAVQTLMTAWERDPRVADRRPGSPGDEALAARVAAALRTSAFAVSQRTFTGRTIDGKRTLRAVTAERAGTSTRRIVVVAFRDGSSLADTAALVELGHVLGGRTLNRTIDLVSTSGREGGAGALDAAQNLGGPVDAVIVISNFGATGAWHPWVAPFASDERLAPIDLQRTVESAVRSETGADSGEPGLPTQFARLAFPLTLGGQAPFLARGVPAVQVGPMGERTEAGGFSLSRVQHYGRATLRAITALDESASVRAPSPYLTLKGQVIPPWTVRLLVAALLLPLLVAAVDGFARLNRRRHQPLLWLRWAIVGVIPFVLGVLFLRFLQVTGALHAVPPGPVQAGAIHIGGGGVAALLGTPLVVVLAWVAARPWLLRAGGVRGKPGSPGAAGSVVALLTVLAIVIWALNPFAAMLLVPALHFSLLAVAPETTWSKPLKLGLLVAGLIPAAFVALLYAFQFDMGPLALAWMGALQVAGGQVSFFWALLWALVLGGLAGAAAVVFRAERPAVERPAPAARSITGPGSYAGPGSLGGTESALKR